MNGLLGPVTANRNMLAQAVNSRNKPEFQMKPNTPQGLLDAAALATSPVPIAGDVVGLLADSHRFATQPESRTPLNFGLAALGLIPFLPPLVNTAMSAAAKARGLPSVELPRGPGRNQAGAIVYHGSPHKFDAFDSSKIGTGEGAQAYGHGLYFAENPDVARNYAQKLAQGKPMLDGKPFDESMATSGLSEKAKKIVEYNLFNNDLYRIENFAKQGVPEYVEAWNHLKNKKVNPSPSLYKVDLPDEVIAKMLDYDAPLSKQPEAVKSAIQNLDIPYGGFKESPKQVADFNKSIPADMSVKYPDVSANQFYHDLIGNLGSAKAASEYLRNLGIPGIKYFDAGSRVGGEGTRNYVTFPGNESLLKILSRE